MDSVEEGTEEEERVVEETVAARSSGEKPSETGSPAVLSVSPMTCPV